MSFNDADKYLKLEIALSEFKQESDTISRFRAASAFVKTKLQDNQNFSGETAVSIFFEEAKVFVQALKENFQKFKEAYLQQIITEEKYNYKMGKFGFFSWTFVVFTILAMIFGLVTAYYLFSTELYPKAKGAWETFNALFVFINVPAYFGIIVGVSTWLFFLPIYLFFHKPKAFKKIDAENRVLPDWLGYIERDINSLSTIINNAENEAAQEVMYKKSLRSKRDDLNLKSELNTKEIEARILLIKAEAEAAIAASKSLEEQHERTAQIRLRYEREMVDISRQAASMNDTSLMDKIVILKELIEG